MAKNSTEEFIAKANKVHGDRYDYSKVKQVDSKTKVCIFCKEHGEFWQRPASHLSGRGCPQCGRNSIIMKRRFSKEDFIKKARAIHGNKYDYSKVDYVNSNTKVCIVCPEHGEYWQVPESHLSGRGCPRCGRDSIIMKRRSSKEVFLNKARAIHGNKYDYSKVDYVNSKIKVCIVCPEHGIFWQIPNSHLSGRGCTKCGKDSGAVLRSNSQDIFYERVYNKFANKFDYTKSVFKGWNTPMTITCKEHGDFQITPKRHLVGDGGCPLCRIITVSNKLKKGVDVIRDTLVDRYGDDIILISDKYKNQ